MSRTRPHRWLVLLCAALVLLSACDGGSGTEDADQDAVRAKLTDRLEALPGATVKARVESGLDVGQNNVLVTARVSDSSADDELDALADKIERMIWLSHLDPMGTISIGFLPPGDGEPVLQRLYQDRIDTRQLREKYGPRPDGLRG